MDTDLIRRCVERVPGFELKWSDTLAGVKDYWVDTDCLSQRLHTFCENQYMLDALAAEMVRMVESQMNNVHVFATGVNIESEMTGQRIAEARFGDRTENTLRACDEFFNETDNG